MGRNTVELGRPQMTTWRMCIACWITRATHTHTRTHSEYVTFYRFSTATMIHEHAWMLCYTYTDCLIFSGACYPRITGTVTILALMTIWKKNQYAMPSISPALLWSAINNVFLIHYVYMWVEGKNFQQLLWIRWVKTEYWLQSIEIQRSAFYSRQI
jgi:hypothetical protein